MKRDITNTKDIEHLVDSFYQQVQKDPVIGYIFTDVMEVDWEKHLPRMYQFWETILLGRASFKGNPLLKHIYVNSRERLTEEHFQQWINLWNGTVNKLFEGKRAEQAKKKAKNMKELLIIKIVRR